jgi:hypothetical protein
VGGTFLFYFSLGYLLISYQVNYAQPIPAPK